MKNEYHISHHFIVTPSSFCRKRCINYVTDAAILHVLNSFVPAILWIIATTFFYVSTLAGFSCEFLQECKKRVFLFTCKKNSPTIITMATCVTFMSIVVKILIGIKWYVEFLRLEALDSVWPLLDAWWFTLLRFVRFSMWYSCSWFDFFNDLRLTYV